MTVRGWRGWMNAPVETPKITRALLGRVLGYARPYRRLMATMLVLILVQTGIALLSPLIMRDLIDRAIPAGDVRRLVTLAAALLVIPVVDGAVNVARQRVSARVGEGVIYDLRVALYASLQRMSLRFFTHTRVGELMSRMNNDVRGAQEAISSTTVGIITQAARAVAVAAVMLTLEWRLTLISILILPLFFVAVRALGQRLRQIAYRQMDAMAQMNATMNETLNIGGALLVKLFGRREQEIERFSGRASEVRDLGVQRALAGSVFGAVISLVSAVGSGLVFGLGGYLVIRGAFTVGTIVAFGTYLGSLYGALQALTNAPVAFATSMVSFERVFEVIDLPVDIPERSGAVPLMGVRGELVFDDVTFRYDAATAPTLSDVKRYGSMDTVTAVLSGGAAPGVPERPAGGRRGAAPANDGADPAAGGTDADRADAVVDAGAAPGAETVNDDEAAAYSQGRELALEGISFRAAPGQLVALVGPSGAGKTTLTYLIPRLYDPTAGAIRIDGRDLRDVTLASLSAAIGMVTQETYLFHDTIRTNLLYARLDATQAELEAACRVANIHAFIASLPEGYDTIVGERGYRLSGGEKQRLALARVILKDPRILVLDEATSSLDSESEALIQDALGRVMAGRTSVVIAHRLSTILAAHQILVIDRGRIVERGDHASLLAEGGLYAHLYRTQFRQ